MTLFLQSWCYQSNNCYGSYLLLMKMYAIKQMCKILNKKAKFTFWCNLDFRFLQFRLYCALYWSRAPYICAKMLLSAKWSTSLSTIESITPKSRIENHETKWKNLFWCFVKPKLILWIVESWRVYRPLKITYHSIVAFYCMLHHSLFDCNIEPWYILRMQRKQMYRSPTSKCQ